MSAKRLLSAAEQGGWEQPQNGQRSMMASSTDEICLADCDSESSLSSKILEGRRIV